MIVPNHAAADALTYTQFFSPLTLFVVFLVAFVAHSVIVAPPAKDLTVQPLGPGGKPLPRNLSPAAKADQVKQIVDFSPARKALFNWLSVGVLFTLIASAVLAIVHALVKRAENWWCGQSVVVSDHTVFPLA